ncbi:ATP-binding protein [Thermodesulfitimonas autotrophica]|uniref:ATP-binding protein n=1 Tax=Thermodesulfitimonas autotrophica TaxID=1894989 RepID=UPI003CCC8B88
MGKHHNLIITGPTRVGKTFIACALGNKAKRRYSAQHILASALEAHPEDETPCRIQI